MITTCVDRLDPPVTSPLRIRHDEVLRMFWLRRTMGFSGHKSGGRTSKWTNAEIRTAVNRLGLSKASQRLGLGEKRVMQRLKGRL